MTTPDVPAERGRGELHERLLAIIESRRMAPWTDKGRAFCVMCGSRWDGEHKPECWVPTLREAAALLATQDAPETSDVAAGPPSRVPDGSEVGPGPRSDSRATAAPQEAREPEGVEKLMSELARIARLFRSASELGSAVLVPIAADIDNARATIKALAAARPAPETREPELLGYVVERQLTTGEWMRVWRGRTMWFDHDEAVLDRDAYALDGIPARIRPVYLGAPAPAEATEPSAPEPKGLRVYGNILPPDAPEALHFTLAPASGEPSGAEAVVREAWRPIETAPKDSARRLLAGANEMGPWVCIGYWFGGAWRDGGPGFIETPTHWMPLPQAPGAPEEGAGE